MHGGWGSGSVTPLALPDTAVFGLSLGVASLICQCPHHTSTRLLLLSLVVLAVAVNLPSLNPANLSTLFCRKHEREPYPDDAPADKRRRNNSLSR
jgi:hypothetical protein